MDHQQLKADIRQQVLAQRDAIAPMRRIELSIAACEHGSQNVRFEPGTIISGFFPIRSEIDPTLLMDSFRQRGARLCLPVVADKTTILFREFNRDTELVNTGFGTRGPGPQVEVVDPEILIMPLSAFDAAGGRIGYGAGHYDRAIARLLARGMKPKLIGFAFSCQQVDSVPVESHDQPLDAIVTENGYRVIGDNPDLPANDHKEY